MSTLTFSIERVICTCGAEYDVPVVTPFDPDKNHLASCHACGELLIHVDARR